MSEKKLWLRRADERAQHYAAFRAYLDMGSGRSLEKLAEQFRAQAASESRSSVPTIRVATLRVWSAKYEWVARVDAYEDHLGEIEREEIENRAREWVRKELDDAEAMLARWGEAWESTPYHEQDVVREIPDPDHPGQMMRVIVIRANVGKMRSLTHWRKDISDQARRAMGLPHVITQGSLDLTGKVEHELTWKERVEKANQEADERAAAHKATLNGNHNGHAGAEELGLEDW